MKKKYDALKELEKGVAQKEVALRFGVQKSTLSTWKRNKIKIEEAYHAGLGNKRMRPEKYEDLNKALMKWFLNTYPNSLLWPVIPVSVAKIFHK